MKLHVSTSSIHLFPNVNSRDSVDKLSFHTPVLTGSEHVKSRISTGSIHVFPNVKSRVSVDTFPVKTRVRKLVLTGSEHAKTRVRRGRLMHTVNQDK